jgi:hypothetical protein
MWGGRTGLADEDRAFERWLLGIAAQQLEPGDREAVKEVIARMTPH